MATMPYAKLTTRELEVIQKIASGHRTQDIAEMLCISPSTVQVHRKNMMRKMNVRNCMSVVDKCRKRGWI